MKTQTGTSVGRQRVQSVCLPFLVAALLLHAQTACAQVDQVLDATGGEGGAQYVARCPAGDVLTGFDLRVGDDVDAIRPLCRAAHGPTQTGPVEPYPSQFGGNGGGPRRIVCPDDAPLIVGMGVKAEGVKTIIVNNVHLYCGSVAVNQAPTANPSVVFDGPPAHYSDAIIAQTGNSVQYRGSALPQTCPEDLVAVGINGRSGMWLDAVGLICGALPPAARPPAPLNIVPGNAGKPPVSLGKAKRTQPPIAAPIASHAAIDAALAGQTEPPICAAARSAKEHKSPAAPGLERQCAAVRAKAERQP